MKASYFESLRYVAPQKLPAEWPLPPRFYEPDVGAQAVQSMIERLELVEELGFDWVSFSEHHYSARILSPSPIVAASHMAAYLHKLKIAVLGPIMDLREGSCDRTSFELTKRKKDRNLAMVGSFSTLFRSSRPSGSPSITPFLTSS